MFFYFKIINLLQGHTYFSQFYILFLFLSCFLRQTLAKQSSFQMSCTFPLLNFCKCNRIVPSTLQPSSLSVWLDCFQNWAGQHEFKVSWNHYMIRFHSVPWHLEMSLWRTYFYLFPWYWSRKAKIETWGTALLIWTTDIV